MKTARHPVSLDIDSDNSWSDLIQTTNEDKSEDMIFFTTPRGKLEHRQGYTQYITNYEMTREDRTCFFSHQRAQWGL